MDESEKFDATQEPASQSGSGANCTRPARGKLALLAVGVALWIIGALDHNGGLSIAGLVLALVGFVACGGA